MREISAEKHFDNYIRSVSDEVLVQFYQDIEWTYFPVIVLDEYQRRFKSKTKRNILEELKRRAEITKRKSVNIGKITASKGYQVSKKLKGKTTRGISKSIQIAKTLGPSSMESLQLIEKLGKLKEAGLITEKEFQQKKKQLFKNI